MRGIGGDRRSTIVPRTAYLDAAAPKGQPRGFSSEESSISEESSMRGMTSFSFRSRPLRMHVCALVHHGGVSFYSAYTDFRRISGAAEERRRHIIRVSYTYIRLYSSPGYTVLMRLVPARLIPLARLGRRWSGGRRR